MLRRVVRFAFLAGSRTAFLTSCALCYAAIKLAGAAEGYER